MRGNNWPGISTAVAILWIIATVLWLGVAGPIWKAGHGAGTDAWIGFAGNALAATISLLAMIAAGFAAYKTIVPMQRQLTELVRQNQFALYERLRGRARELNDEKRLVYRVTSDLELVERSLAAQGLGARDILRAATDRLSDGVQLLWEANASVWGDKEAQEHRKQFIETSLRAATGSSSLAPGSNPNWRDLRNTAFAAGVVVHARIELELQILSDEIAFLEPGILGRPNDFPFPMLKQVAIKNADQKSNIT